MGNQSPENPKPLWEHQKIAIAKAAEIGRYGFLFEPGTGKTRTAIETLRALYTKEGRILRTLILAPPIVLENWKQEFKKFSVIDQKKIIILSGSETKRIANFTNWSEGQIFITNYEALLMKGLFNCFQGCEFEAIVADESHRIKSHDAKRTKALIQLSKPVKHKFILTGTPMLKNLMDLYSQFLFLDGGKSLGDNFFIFRNTYFFDKNAGFRGSHKHWPDWRLKENSKDEIIKKICDKAMFVKKEDCLDLPPLIKKEVLVELSKKQRELYEEMKKNLITFINEEAVTAELALTKALRLQQIVSGYVKTEDGNEITLEDNPRIDALKDLLEDLAYTNKVIVWACFKQNYSEIKKVCEKLKLKYVEVTGETKISSRQDLIDQFNSDPECNVFIGNQGAGGIGINLASSNIAIYYSRNFSLEHDVQSEARNYRGGSEIHDKITRIDIVARDTIDEKVLLALASKQEIADIVLRELRG